MKIAVAGATGRVGRHVVDVLEERGGVLVLERHLLDALVDIEWQYPHMPLGVHRALLRGLMTRYPSRRAERDFPPAYRQVLHELGVAMPAR